MKASTPRGFGLRVLEVDTETLDECLAGLLDDEEGLFGYPAVTAERAAAATTRPEDPFAGLPPPH